jgi:hypothetical protein
MCRSCGPHKVDGPLTFVDLGQNDGENCQNNLARAYELFAFAHGVCGREEPACFRVQGVVCERIPAHACVARRKKSVSWVSVDPVARNEKQ